MRSRRLFAQRLFVLAVACAAPAVAEQSAYAVGEQNARLSGTVLEAGTGVPMPGAKVTIRSEAMIGGSKSTMTDDDGRFDFLSIPHGSYDVTVEYEGLQPIKRRVKLQLGETRTLKLDFAAELAQGETTKIFEERTRIDSEKVSTGRVLTAEQQSKIATGRSYQNIVQQLPGVVGGGNPVMAGGSLRHNRYLVDGLDITDPVSNTFSSNGKTVVWRPAPTIRRHRTRPNRPPPSPPPFPNTSKKISRSDRRRAAPSAGNGSSRSRGRYSMPPANTWAPSARPSATPISTASIAICNWPRATRSSFSTPPAPSP